MKNYSISFIAVALLATIFIAGCQKNTTNDAPVETITLDPDGLYLMSSSDGTSAYEKLEIDLDNLSGSESSESVLKSGNSHINAHYSWQENSFGHGFYKSTTVQINATENSQGVSGTGHMWRTWGDEGEFAFQIIMDADCIESNGEDAVFAGIVTDVIGELPTLYPSVGSRLWVKVKDNGQGPNAPLDQYEPTIVWNPGATIPCGLFGLNFFLWGFLPDEDVANESDNINVN